MGGFWGPDSPFYIGQSVGLVWMFDTTFLSFKNDFYQNLINESHLKATVAEAFFYEIFVVVGLRNSKT